MLGPLKFFKQSCCYRVAVVFGIDHCRVATFGFGPRIGAGFKQCLYSMVAAINGGQHQWCMAIAVPGIYLCPFSINIFTISVCPFAAA